MTPVNGYPSRDTEEKAASVGVYLVWRNGTLLKMGPVTPVNGYPSRDTGMQAHCEEAHEHRLQKKSGRASEIFEG